MLFSMLFIDKATITRAAFRTLRRAAWTFFFERLRPPPAANLAEVSPHLLTYGRGLRGWGVFAHH